MANDLFASLKTLVTQFQEGEKNASDLMHSLNTWARDIGDLIRDKVEEEVESSVKKMGFVKRDEFNALEARLRELESSASKKAPVTSLLKKSSKKPATKKKSAQSKKSAEKTEKTRRKGVKK